MTHEFCCTQFDYNSEKKKREMTRRSEKKMYFFILFFFLVHTVRAADWAVIIVGSEGYWNYRHAAAASSAYQSFLKRGIPKQNIIMFMGSKELYSENNPYQGNLFYYPGQDSTNVFTNMIAEYGSSEITSNRILNALIGNSFSGKRVLRSSFFDTVYIAVFEYGAPGVITLPQDVIFGNDLQETIKTMFKKRMYKKLVFVIDGEKSDTLFLGMSLNDYNVELVNPESLSIENRNIFCPPNDIVRGSRIGSCMNTLFSYKYWGNGGFEVPQSIERNLFLDNEVIGVLNTGDKKWSVYDSKLEYLFRIMTGDQKSAESRRALQVEDSTRSQIEQYFLIVARNRKVEKEVVSITEWDCYRRGVKKVETLFLWDEYTFNFFGNIVNMCEQNKWSF